ncbi:MAG: phosphate/phosphite/phosphonate ABC transporter substrate-binding protein [Burkholderiales bacterium]
MNKRRSLLIGTAGLASVAALRPVVAQSKKLRFGVGPLLPSAEDTRKTFMPLFAHLAKQMGADFDLVATTDWAGMAVAMGSGNLDVAWMGPWGYVLANSSTGCQAVATVKYDDKPIYFAIIVARPDLVVNKFPDDTRGRSISFADLGSTSGWLIPSYYAKEVWKIDPKTYWKYSEGATHAANEIAVSAGHVDMATDFDRNRNAMIDSGRIKADSTKIVWTSAPLPNDAIAVPKGASREMSAQVQKILTAINLDQAKSLLPARYTGFVANTHAGYKSIEDAGVAVGRIKRA